MNSAIPPHLRCPRSQAIRAPADYTPPYPGWSAAPGPDIERVAMAYYGVQWLDARDEAHSRDAISNITTALTAASGADRIDHARFVDPTGYTNHLVAASWANADRYQDWWQTGPLRPWWEAAERLNGPIGCFREVLTPAARQFETLYSSPSPVEGIGAALANGVGDPVVEHAYWGSMRDRLPLAQTDPLAPEGELYASGAPGHGRRVQVRGHSKVALIRSGQDWTSTVGAERTIYEKRMEPVLRAGMDFLARQGIPIGCYSNRYVQQVDHEGVPIEKSFGLSFWRSLEALENWAEHHSTHKAIFGTFLTIVQEFNFNLALRLYHEVSVLWPEDQTYEYINCHEQTGLCSAVSAGNWKPEAA